MWNYFIFSIQIFQSSDSIWIVIENWEYETLFKNADISFPFEILAKCPELNSMIILHTWVLISGRGIHFFVPTTSRPALDSTQFPIQGVLGAFLWGVKCPGRKADHSPPSSAKVKNAWDYTFTLLYVFMVWYLVKHRDTFTFIFTYNFTFTFSFYF